MMRIFLAVTESKKPQDNTGNGTLQLEMWYHTIF